MIYKVIFLCLVMTIGSFQNIGTIPLINNTGQIVNPNPIGTPISYGVNQGGQITGVTTPIVNNQKVVTNPSPVKQFMFIPSGFTIAQSKINTSPYNYGISPNLAGGAGSSQGSGGGSSSNVGTLVVIGLVALALLK